MKTRATINPLFALLILGISWFCFHSIIYYLIGRIYSWEEEECLWIGSPFFGGNKILITCGFTLLITTLLSNTIGGLPLNFYKTDKKTYEFSHLTISFILKIALFSVGIILFSYGIYQYETQDESPSDLGSYIGYIFFITIILLLLIKVIIPSWKTLVNNKEDYIIINENSIEWYDNDSNKTQVLRNSIKKIQLKGPSENKEISLFIENNIVLIPIKKMSLKPFGEKIAMALKNNFSEIEIVEIKSKK